MEKTSILTKAGGVLNKIGFGLKKHSPEIFIVAGVVGAVTSAVLACKATLKVDKVLNETKEKMDKVHEATEKERTEAGEEYSAEDAQKDTAIIYTHTALKIAKLYAPAIAIGVLSVVSIFASNTILRKRSASLAAAYATLDTGFKAYRKRVVERFGENVDRELKHNIKAEKVNKTVIDEETGKEKKVKEDVFTVNRSDVSGYARLFEKYTEDEDGNRVLNPNWESNNDYNLMFLKAQESYANDLLRVHKRLFLNDVYEMLGFPRSKAGQVVGWVYDPENPTGDNFVDFGIYANNLNLEDEECEPVILLDFNVDGNIWDLM